MSLYSQLRDAQRALGFGLAFVAYSAYLFYDVYRTRRRNREDTLAQMVAQDAGSKAEQMRAEEFDA